MAATLEAVQVTLERVEKATEAMSTIMSQHLRDDTIMRRDVDEVMEWKDAADADIQTIKNQRVWLMGIVAGLGLGGTALGNWLIKVFS